MKNKNENPDNLCVALDCAIRDSEKEKYGYTSGYIVRDSDTKYSNYMSNEAWKEYLENMAEEHRVQYEDGNGGELKEKKGRWGIVPPKMASFGSSSRFIYELSKNVTGYAFEVKLDTRVGGVANLDGFLRKGNNYVYVEAKRREIYGSSHENEKIKSVYIPVYEKIKNNCKGFKYEQNDCKEPDMKKITFCINDTPIKYFDLKQLICHFLGITYDIAKNNIQNAKVTFLYLIYDPNEVCEFIAPKYKEKIKDRYESVKKFVSDNKDVINSIFQTLLQYQKETYNLVDLKIDFDFKMVSQKDYNKELLSC